jgi:hypothetical protein
MRVKKGFTTEATNQKDAPRKRRFLTEGAAHLFGVYINKNSGYITLNTTVGETGYCIWKWLKMTSLEY